MTLEILENIMGICRLMAYKLSVLETAKSQCHTAIETMKKFSSDKKSFSMEIEEFINLLSTITVLNQTIEDIHMQLDDVGKQVMLSQDISLIVMWKRDIEQKPLKVIADEISYSYDYIRKISARNPYRINCTHFLAHELLQKQIPVV